jgi:hypothetical protein
MRGELHYVCEVCVKKRYERRGDDESVVSKKINRYIPCEDINISDNIPLIVELHQESQVDTDLDSEEKIYIEEEDKEEIIKEECIEEQHKEECGSLMIQTLKLLLQQISRQTIVIKRLVLKNT